MKNKPTESRAEASVYIGVVGPDTEYGICGDSIRNINTREGDTKPYFIRATKGFDARTAHIGRFLSGDKGAILLLDSDMVFEPNTLEKLRSHGLPYVSGYYMRRQFRPIAPVMFEYNEHNEWPHAPLMTDPKAGQVYKIGASGWGCVLVHREVFDAVEPLLKGEPFVIEDDMDVWPYDLETMMRLIRILNTSEDMKQMKRAARVLANEFKPLTGDKENVGSDVRFPFFAKQAGYTQYLDPAVRPGHIINYSLSADDYSQAIESGMQGGVTQATKDEVLFHRTKWRERIWRLKND